MKTYDELKALIEQRGVHPVFGSSGVDNWNIEQNAAELAEFLVVCQEQGVQSVLEIGTGYRAGLARFLHEDMGWQVTSVDIHDYGHQFGGIQFLTRQSLETYNMPVDGWDLVIIDADHSAEGVRTDYADNLLYANKLLMIHDIAGLRDCEAVREFWNKLAYRDGKIRQPFHEIIADGDQRGGIGYIVLSEVQAAEAAPEVKTWKGFTHEIKEGWAKTPEAEPEKKPAPAKKTAAKKAATRKTATKK